jgi:hybrid cluster-associated redox disulfide protein
MALLLEFDACTLHRFRRALFALHQAATRKQTIFRFAVLFAPAQRAVTQALQSASMETLARPTTEQTVDDVMRRWPSTIHVFIEFRMHCVGCPIATFHSVEEACREHGIDLATFLRSLHRAVQASAVQVPVEADLDWPSARANSP